MNINVGFKFNNFTVIKKLSKDYYSKIDYSDYSNYKPIPFKKWQSNTFWECECSCGRKVLMYTSAIKRGGRVKCYYCNKLPTLSYELDDTFWKKILKAAKIRDIPVDITRDEAYNVFIQQKKKCAISGVDIDFPLYKTQKYLYSATASLDRIDSSKGYILTNIQWVHKHVNVMKNIYSNEYFIGFCKKIAEHNK